MSRYMLDFAPVLSKEIRFAELVAPLTIDDLRQLTNNMIDSMLELIADCTDENVVFMPTDPNANDTFAADGVDADLAWTLAHVIVHATASSEEGAAIAAGLARGVEFNGRSRSEVDWESVTTIAQVRHRLEESRRMRLASLEMWPDAPHLDNVHEPYPFVGEINAVGYFVTGLFHDNSHLEQIAEIVRQATLAA